MVAICHIDIEICTKIQNNFYFMVQGSYFFCTFAAQKENKVKERLIYVSFCLLLTLIFAACKSAHYCNCG